MALRSILVLVTVLVVTCTEPLPQQESLETLLFRKLAQYRWTRIDPSLTVDRLTKLTHLDSILFLRNSTGFADILFTYQQDANTTVNHTYRYANLLIVRLYDSPYIDTFHTEVRVPLLNYSQKQRKWSGDTVMIITFYDYTTKLGSFSKTIQYEVDNHHTVLKLSKSEIVMLEEDYTIKVKYFPILYMYLTVICLATALMKRTEEPDKLSPLLALILAMKMLLRSVFLFTHSFTTPSPDGGVLVMMATINSFLTIRFAHRYSCCFETRKHFGTTVLIVLLLVAVEVLLVFNPYYNSATGLLMLLQISANLQSNVNLKNAEKQCMFVCCFLLHSLLTVYYSICDGNIFRIQPVPWAGCFIIIVLTVQFVVLKVQENYAHLRRFFLKRRNSAPLELTSTDCPICLSPLESSVELVVTECLHAFHYDCLSNWTAIRGTCPLDRKPINPDFLMNF